MEVQAHYKHRRKRSTKNIKALEGRFRYVVGHDIYLDRVTSLCSRALVGRLEYARMNKADWVDWANTFWKPLINYIPTISLLSRGWIVFVFLEEKHCQRIMDGIWRIGKGSLVLNRWHSHFDPLRERITKRHLWTLLPQLPFPLWNKKVLEGIANSIGRFVDVDPDFHLAYDKRMARVLVELDVS